MTARATRRGVLALAPAAALATASAAGGHSRAANTPHPDAELLAACARFRALNARHAAIYTDPVLDDDAKDAAWDALRQQQEENLVALHQARATTLEGIVARGQALTAFVPEKVEPEFDPAGMYWDDAMLNALLRDLMALAKASGRA